MHLVTVKLLLFSNNKIYLNNGLLPSISVDSGLTVFEAVNDYLEKNIQVPKTWVNLIFMNVESLPKEVIFTYRGELPKNLSHLAKNWKIYDTKDIKLD